MLTPTPAQIDIHMVLRCAAPVQHGAFGGSAGNAVLCRRMSVVSLPGRPRVPCVSGNALRGQLRRLVMRHLFASLQLDRGAFSEPGRWDRLYAALANGGHLESAETTVRPDDIRALREALPPLSLFGAALYSWLLPGRLESVGILWPRCRETTEARLVREGSEVAAEDLVEEISHCRHVDREEQDPQVSGVTPMPTTVEALCVGTVLETTIRFAPHTTDVERACLAHGIALLRHLGGKASAGFGLVEVIEGPTEEGAAPYRAWLASGTARDALVALAEQLAPPRRRKA